MRNAISLLLALVVMYFASVVDKLTIVLRQRTASDFQVGPRLWPIVGLEVAFIAAILLLAWAVALRLRPDRWVGGIWLVLGAAVLLYLPLLIGGPGWLSDMLSSDLLRLPRTALMEGGIHSYLLDASAAIAILGGWLLFRKRAQTQLGSLP